MLMGAVARDVDNRNCGINFPRTPGHAPTVRPASEANVSDDARDFHIAGFQGGYRFAAGRDVVNAIAGLFKVPL